MSSIKVEFKFELGDLVFFCDAEHSNDVRPRHFSIYERVPQQCHGGIQRFYKLNGVTNQVPEILLTKEEPPFRPVSDAWLADRMRVMAAERQMLNELEDARWTKRQKLYKKKEDPPA